MKNTLKLLALFSFGWSFAQAPAYYDDVNLSLTGQNLLSELATKVTNTHTTNISYTPGVWNALQDADINPDNSSNILLIYGYNDQDSDGSNDRSRDANNIDSGGTSTSEYWNREHVYPKSLGNPNLGTTGAGADAHHIRPADPTMNSTRSNRIYADGSGNAGITNQGYWYPGDEWKGDVARMIMYMYLRYNDRCLPSVVGDGNTLSSDSNMIDLFLEWNVEDPVSDFEQQRNEIITDIQGNRNPFIDNPAIATDIWGGAQAEDLFGDTTTDIPTEDNNASLIISEYVEGSSNNKAIEISNISNSSVNLSNYTLKKDTNGGGNWSTTLSLSGTLQSGSSYVIVNNSASSALISLADNTTSSTVMTFNGNDPIGLFYNNTLIDVVGTYAGGSSNFAQNQTLVRSSSSIPTTNYSSSQWTSYSTDTYSFLGSYSNSSNTNANTSIDASLNITFDNYASETSWEILDSSNTTVFSGSNYGNYDNGDSISISMKLDVDCYTLKFYDSYGDGICCSNGNGSYSLIINGSSMASGASFSTSDSSAFCLSNSSSKNLISTELNNTSNTELITYPNPAYNNLYIAGAEEAKTIFFIYNLAGTEITSGTLNDKKINIENLAQGQYIISIINGTETSTNYFVKK